MSYLLSLKSLRALLGLLLDTNDSILLHHSCRNPYNNLEPSLILSNYENTSCHSTCCIRDMVRL